MVNCSLGIQHPMGSSPASLQGGLASPKGCLPFPGSPKATASSIHFAKSPPSSGEKAALPQHPASLHEAPAQLGQQHWDAPSGMDVRELLQANERLV